MTFVEGFVLAVPADKKEAYRRHAEDAVPLFKEFGATRMVECWGDDVPVGKVTDFRGAVKAEEGEVVLFSWIEYPSRTVRDSANEKMMSDPRMEAMGADMPFDARRMIFAGFEPIVEEASAGALGYTDGFLVPVKAENKEAYRQMAAKAAPIFREYGAVRVVEAWADQVPDGKVTDFKGAVKAKPGEAIVYSWIEWPSKEARDEGWKQVMADPRMQPDHANMPFDGQRMIWGGFSPIVDA